jgi:hypothetical protein
MLDGFISYSHKDHVMRDGLLRHLAPAETHVQFWVDRSITAGEKWSREIEDHIDKARIFILLVSSHFNVSPFIRDTEWPRIKARAEACAGLIVPVKIRPCAFMPWLEDIQAVPVIGGDLKPVSRCRPQDHGFYAAAEQLFVAMDRQVKGWRPARP